MKKQYDPLELEIILLAADVLTASDPGGMDPGRTGQQSVKPPYRQFFTPVDRSDKRQMLSLSAVGLGQLGKQYRRPPNRNRARHTERAFRI